MERNSRNFSQRAAQIDANAERVCDFLHAASPRAVLADRGGLLPQVANRGALRRAAAAPSAAAQQRRGRWWLRGPLLAHVRGPAHRRGVLRRARVRQGPQPRHQLHARLPVHDPRALRGARLGGAVRRACVARPRQHRVGGRRLAPQGVR
jgi:hypothetical protein